MQAGDRLPALLVAASSSAHTRPPAPFALSTPLGSRTPTPNGSVVSASSSSTSLAPGWCSARNAAFPQWLVFHVGRDDAAAPPHIATLQILAHHFKIPSAIEIWTGDVGPAADVTPAQAVDQLAWSKYGHIVMSTNSASNYRARELKTVPVAIQARYVKLVLQRNYHNDLNLWGQVALLGVNFFGDQSSDGAASPNKENTRLDSSILASQHSRAAFTMGYTAIDAVERAKRAAAAAENYPHAATLKSLSSKLRDIMTNMEVAQRNLTQSASREQYDQAESWRTALVECELNLQDMMRQHGLQYDKASCTVTLVEPLSPPHPLHRATDPVLSPRSTSASKPAVKPTSPAQIAMAEPQSPTRSQPSPTRAEQGRSPSPPLPRIDTSSRTTSPSPPSRNAGPVARSPPPIRKSSPASPPLASRKPQPSNKDPVRTASPSGAAPSNGPLSEEQRVDYRACIDFAGEDLVARFLARDFDTKGAACEAILAHLGTMTPETADTYIKGAFGFMDRALPDTRERLVVWAISLWRAAADHPHTDTSLLLNLSQHNWTLLLAKAGDVNPRIARAAKGLAVHLLCAHPHAFAAATLRPGAPTTGPWRQLCARVEIAEAAVPQCGVATDDSMDPNASFRRSSLMRPARGTGLPLDDLRNMIATHLSHNHAQVRDVASRLLIVVAQAAGAESVAPCLEGLAQRSQVQALREKLDRVAQDQARARQTAALKSRPPPQPVPTTTSSTSKPAHLAPGKADGAPVSTSSSPQGSKALPDTMPLRPRASVSGLPQPSQPPQLRRTASSISPTTGGTKEAPPATRFRNPTVESRTTAVTPSPIPPESSVSAPSTVSKATGTKPAAPKPASPGPGTKPSKPAPAAAAPTTFSPAAKKTGFWDRLFKKNKSDDDLASTKPLAKSGSSFSLRSRSSSGSMSKSLGSGSVSVKPAPKSLSRSGSATAGTKAVSAAASSSPAAAKTASKPAPGATAARSSQPTGATAPVSRQVAAATTATNGPTSTAIPASQKPTNAAAAATTDNDDDDLNAWNVDYSCVFCEEQNPQFTTARLDEHYWRECPMLGECPYCRTIVELQGFHDHVAHECPMPPATAPAAGQCLACGRHVGATEHAFRKHLLTAGGCPKHARKPRPGVKYRI